MQRNGERTRRPLIAAWLMTAMIGLGVAGCSIGPGASSQPSGSLPVSPGQTTTTTAHAVQQQIDALAGVTQVDTATNQIRYTTQDVTIVAVGSPPGREGEYWQVDGRVNPSVSVPAGAKITVDVVNGDPDMPHGWVLTTSAPPYAQMPMMGGGMYGGGGMMATYAMVPPLPATQGAGQWPMTSLSFTAPSAGVYYYICQVPDHAEEGMWGKLIVQ